MKDKLLIPKRPFGEDPYFLRSQVGAAGENSAVNRSTAVQVAISFPLTSNPPLHVYVAVSESEFPVDVTPPLSGPLGSLQRATLESGKIKPQCKANNCNS